MDRFHSLRHLPSLRQPAERRGEVRPVVCLKSEHLQEGSLATIVGMCGIEQVLLNLFLLDDCQMGVRQLHWLSVFCVLIMRWAKGAYPLTP